MLLQYSQPMVSRLAPLTLVGETLPPATSGVFYSQDISGQAFGGTAPYNPFSEITSIGPDTISVSSAGVISFTPTTTILLTDIYGNFLLSASGAWLTE